VAVVGGGGCCGGGEVVVAWCLLLVFAVAVLVGVLVLRYWFAVGMGHSPQN
jgi:hypothetical protein